MGQMGFYKNLRVSAVFCKNLRFPAVMMILDGKFLLDNAQLGHNWIPCDTSFLVHKKIIRILLIPLDAPLFFTSKRSRGYMRCVDFLNPTVLDSEGNHCIGDFGIDLHHNGHFFSILEFMVLQFKINNSCPRSGMFCLRDWPKTLWLNACATHTTAEHQYSNIGWADIETPTVQWTQSLPNPTIFPQPHSIPWPDPECTRKIRGSDPPVMEFKSMRL